MSVTNHPAEHRCFSSSSTDNTSDSTILSSKLLARAQSKRARHEEVGALLMATTTAETGSSSFDNNQQAELGREFSELARLSALCQRLEDLHDEHVSIRELQGELDSGREDDDLRAECEEECRMILLKVVATERRIVDAVLPRDEEDYTADCILELRAGTGGDEAALFAGELLSTYEKTVSKRNSSNNNHHNHTWKCETLSVTRTDLGGVREAVLSISSSGGGGYYSSGSGTDTDDYDDLEDTHTDESSFAFGPYGFFKYESGVHRVQRVPVNDVRIHTSVASVAVLSSHNHTNNDTTTTPLNPADLKIDTYRASGAGGQHVNTTESAVRITHLPTGVVAAIQDERSQHKNRAKALKLVTARVRNAEREADRARLSQARSELMGGGGRSERIRTYNFAQDRVTDHRCKHSEYGIAKLLSGGGDHQGDEEGGLVGSFAPRLRKLYREELLREIEDEEED